MAYTPTNWNTGDIITAALANNWETGIDDAHDAIETADMSTEAEATAYAFSLPSTAVKGQMNTIVKGNTVTNLLGTAGDCENTADFVFTNCAGALDTTYEVFGTNCIKITLSAAQGTMDKEILSSLIAAKYYFIAAYLKNENATNLKLRFETDDQDAESSAMTSTTTTRTGIVIQPSDFNTATTAKVQIQVNGSNTQYAYVDGIQILEISATEYALGVTAMLAKYNYINSTKSTTPQRIRGSKNKVINAPMLWKQQKGSENITLSRNMIKVANTAAVYGKGLYEFNVEQNTTYYYAYAYISVGVSNDLRLGTSEAGTDILYKAYASAGTGLESGTFNSGSNTKLYLSIALHANASNSLQIDNLIISSIDGSYDREGEVEAYTMPELRKVGTVADEVEVQTGKYAKNISDWVTLDGSKDWGYGVDALGYKRVFINNFVPDSGAISHTATVYGVKYNTKVLEMKPGLEMNAADQVGTGTVGLNITVSDVDSGWLEEWTNSTSFTGMTWENLIKAYFNGWKLTTVSTDVANCVWTGIASSATQSGSGGYDVVRTTVDTGFTPYKVIYQLATPVVTYLDTQVITAHPSGTIVVEPGIRFEDKPVSTVITIPDTDYTIKTVESVSKVIKVDDYTTKYEPVDSADITNDTTTITISGADDDSYYEVKYAYNSELSTIPTLAYGYPENIKASVDENTDMIGQIAERVAKILAKLYHLDTDKLDIVGSTASVGLGIDTAVNKLTIKDEFAGIRLLSDTTGDTSDDGVYIGLDGEDNMIISQKENKYIMFGANGQDRVFIPATGGLQIRPIDDVSEGGEIILEGAGDYADEVARFDRSADLIRLWIENGSILEIPKTGNLSWDNNAIWNAGNDGTGSGLDADLLDGEQAAAFMHTVKVYGNVTYTDELTAGVTTKNIALGGNYNHGKLTINTGTGYIVGSMIHFGTDNTKTMVINAAGKSWTRRYYATLGDYGGQDRPIGTGDNNIRVNEVYIDGTNLRIDFEANGTYSLACMIDWEVWA